MNRLSESTCRKTLERREGAHTSLPPPSSHVWVSLSNLLLQKERKEKRMKKKKKKALYLSMYVNTQFAVSVYTGTLHHGNLRKSLDCVYEQGDSDYSSAPHGKLRQSKLTRLKSRDRIWPELNWTELNWTEMMTGLEEKYPKGLARVTSSSTDLRVAVRDKLLKAELMVEVLLYVHRNRRFIRDGSSGRPPRLSHRSWTLHKLVLLLLIASIYSSSLCSWHLWTGLA